MESVCKFCQAPVAFLKTVGGRSIPFELTPSPEGEFEHSTSPFGFALFVPKSQRKGRDDLFLAHPGRCRKPLR